MAMEGKRAMAEALFGDGHLQWSPSLQHLQPHSGKVLSRGAKDA